ncbi:hypothetical protein PHET_07090 [Paragonimus heterotremus]|uniref:Uncharacterized protein n=1 Tax=Paragonimus heterotremus TaxID=100268 RepID=A0A8J4SN45_9TREM|nr:hypothetical protein PHET_07090 [Paragonimus heterotremus]
MLLLSPILFCMIQTYVYSDGHCYHCRLFSLILIRLTSYCPHLLGPFCHYYPLLLVFRRILVVFDRILVSPT